MSNIEKAIALLRENIDTVPPHGCQRDAVLALLEAIEPEQLLSACGMKNGSDAWSVRCGFDNKHTGYHSWLHLEEQENHGTC